MNDAQYLARIVSGDTVAFAEWMAGAEPRIRASLRRFAAAADTEAVVQETFIRIWQIAHRVKDDGRPEVLTRIALRVARNLAIDECRRNRRQVDSLPFVVDGLEAAPVYQQEDAAELRQALAECFEELPARPRQAMKARLAGRGDDDASLADTINMTANTFFQNIRRARQALADCLARRGITLGFRP
ncbi:MAG: sigma-70 family RNA polymerase sigma factor [Phycisphaerales bacterium]|nr:sigma-70 family RNA polymerase sigma factor [Phycisphaerales bacterium]